MSCSYFATPIDEGGNDDVGTVEFAITLQGIVSEIFIRKVSFILNS
jgi:hypothetical protein